MNTFGAIRRATKAFLEAGFMDGKNFFPTSEGIP
jgi:hypothetical protein